MFKKWIDKIKKKKGGGGQEDNKDLNQIIRTTKTMEYYLANSRKRGTPIESPQSHMHRRNKLLVKITMNMRICHKITQNCMTRFS